MYRGRAPKPKLRPSFAPTSLVGIRMTTMRAERSAADPNSRPTAGRDGRPLNHDTYATVDALAAACGASRLDGGMHFTGAVEAGEELCKGIGTAGFEYASDLIGGEW